MQIHLSSDEFMKFLKGLFKELEPFKENHPEIAKAKMDTCSVYADKGFTVFYDSKGKKRSISKKISINFLFPFHYDKPDPEIYISKKFLAHYLKQYIIDYGLNIDNFDIKTFWLEHNDWRENHIFVELKECAPDNRKPQSFWEYAWVAKTYECRIDCA